MYLEKSQNFALNVGAVHWNKKDVSTLKDEEKDKAEQSKGTFYFEKVKMIGRLRYKIIRTEVSNNEERLEISQKIHRFLRKEKRKPFGDKIIRNRFNGIKNKNGFLGYIVCSAIWG